MKTPIAILAIVLIYFGFLFKLHHNRPHCNHAADTPHLQAKKLTRYVIEDFPADQGQALLAQGWSWMNPDDPRNDNFGIGFFYTYDPDIAQGL